LSSESGACCYERATWAILHIANSQAVAVGSWATARRDMYVPYSDKVRILGHRMSLTTADRGMQAAHTVDSERVKARKVYTNDLILSQRIQYSQT
jgi:hypothetical protein